MALNGTCRFDVSFEFSAASHDKVNNSSPLPPAKGIHETCPKMCCLATLNSQGESWFLCHSEKLTVRQEVACELWFRSSICAKTESVFLNRFDRVALVSVRNGINSATPLSEIQN